MVFQGLAQGLERAPMRTFIYVLIAGFSLGFALWAALHEPQLAPFILNNQLDP